MPIDPELWFSSFSRLLPVLRHMETNELPGYVGGRAAFLEVLWAMACLAFAERGVEHVVVETGLGGRLDPTTANNAEVAVITNVSLDHVERLGYTVEAIAAEKAGLIKPGQHVITACIGDALAVVRETCARQEATLWPVGYEGPDAAIQLLRGDGGEGTFGVRTPFRAHHCLRLGLIGAHQQLNAACAVGAVDALATRSGLVVSSNAIVDGVRLARIPGRLELLDTRPRVLLDGAHNAAGAASLAEALRTLFAGDRIVLLLGILGDKDVTTITRLLSPLAEAIVVSEPPWRGRAGFAESIAVEARRFCALVEQHDDPAAALARARSLAGPRDLVVVAGSLYLAGAVRDLLVPEAAEQFAS